MFKFRKGTLIDKISDSSANMLQELTELMPGLLRRRAEAYYTKLDKLNDEIKNQHSNVDEFITYMKRVEHLNEHIDEFKPEYDFIDSLKMIIVEQKISFPSHTNQKCKDAMN
jgi:hypothetical protein